MIVKSTESFIKGSHFLSNEIKVQAFKNYRLIIDVPDQKSKENCEN
jgi:hypothetical protein